MTINIHFEYPPIPVRSFDWSACVDGWEEDGPYGRGETKGKALVDLGEQIADRLDVDDLNAFIDVQVSILRDDIEAAEKAGKDPQYLAGLQFALRTIEGIV